MPAILSRGAVAKQFIKLLKLLNNPLGNGVTVAQQTLTLFVLVRIQVPQPAKINKSTDLPKLRSSRNRAWEDQWERQLRTNKRAQARSARASVVCSLSHTPAAALWQLVPSRGRHQRPAHPIGVIHLARGCMARIVSGRGGNPLATASALCSFVSRAIF